MSAGATRPTALPLLLLAAALALFFGDLLDPRQLLSTRDVVEFHLPLRLAWSELARDGEGLSRLFPQWDPFGHGGQPLLSNPNFGALYPPSWIGLLLPPPLTLSFLVLLHAAVAAAGAWRLARRLGGDAATAFTCAFVFVCGPTYLALLHSLTQALALSWFPWVVALAVERIDAASKSDRRRVDLRLALTSAALVVAGGDPAVLLMLALALALLALAAPRQALRRGASLVPGLALGAAIAAVQVVPTLARLADSTRAGGLPLSEATLWSLSVGRLPELFFPSFHGDVAHPMSGLYFGWGAIDLDFPYLLLLSVTAPLGLLGLSQLISPRLPLRIFWIGLSAAGLFFAFGRNNPLYAPLRDLIPGMSALRYPEKFTLLFLVALLFGGALGWKRLLDERDGGPARRAELPAALSAILVLVAATLAIGVRLRPELLDSFLRAHSGWPLSATELDAATAYYRRESLTALSFCLAALALFVAARWSRLPRRALEVGFVVLVAGELWVHARPLLRTLPAEKVLAPPAVLAGSGLAPGHRLFSTEGFQRESNELIPKLGDAALNWARAPIERLDARVGNLYGFRYALDKDFDRTLTRPAARALLIYERLRAEPVLAHRLLGAWSVERLVVHRAPASYVNDLRNGVANPAPVRVVPNAFALPAARFVAAFESFDSAERATEAAVAAGLPLNVREYLVDGPVPGQLALGTARLISDFERGDRRRIEYASAAPSLLVVASTYDRRWSAKLGGRPLEIFETAGGYQAVLVPPGSGVVELRFHDPWFGAGAAITAVALLFAALSAVRARLSGA